MALAAAPLPELVESGVQETGLFSRLGTIWEYRELLINLSRRELKVRYKDSALGFLWSLLNPLMYLAIFSIVFGLIIRNADINFFAIYLLSGLIPFNLFSIGLTGATTSITGNGALVQKVWFPREILPIASIGANLVTFFLQVFILFAAMAVFQISPKWGSLWMLVPAILIVLAVSVGLGLILAAVNVYFRDVQHFLELAMQVMFWMTPIVYPFSFVAASLSEKTAFLGDRLGMLNPLTPIVVLFQRVLYNPDNFDRVDGEGVVPDEGEWVFDIMVRDDLWHLQNLAGPAILGVVLLFVGFKVFARLEADLGEHI